MKQLKRSLLYIQGILLLVFIQNAVGIEETPYFLKRKNMLKEMKITLHPRPKDSNVDKYYYSHNLNHSHNYNVTINEPDLCSKHDQVFLLVLIRTYYAHIKWREIQRELLNHESSMPHRKGLIVKHLFIFGKSDNANIERLVRNESKYHRDIIQEDFIESYFNLTKKVITAWKWTVNFCPNAEYVMILNDELLLDLDKIIYFLLQDYSMGQHDDHFALCYARINASSTFLTYSSYKMMPCESLYKGAVSPPYCHGWGYAAHVKVINKLYKASFTNPPFMPTDIYIGVLTEKLRLRLVSHTERYVLNGVEKYFADSLYMTRLGMIAVTDHSGNKRRAYRVMESVMKSMRRHWKIMVNYTIHSYSDCDEFSGNADSAFYVSITVFNFVVIAILCKISLIRLLKTYCCRRCRTNKATQA